MALTPAPLTVYAAKLRYKYESKDVFAAKKKDRELAEIIENYTKKVLETFKKDIEKFFEDKPPRITQSQIQEVVAEIAFFALAYLS
jgi:hypothetical protein